MLRILLRFVFFVRAGRIAGGGVAGGLKGIARGSQSVAGVHKEIAAHYKGSQWVSQGFTWGSQGLVGPPKPAPRKAAGRKLSGTGRSSGRQRCCHVHPYLRPICRLRAETLGGFIRADSYLSGLDSSWICLTRDSDSFGFLACADWPCGLELLDGFPFDSFEHILCLLGGDALRELFCQVVPVAARSCLVSAGRGGIDGQLVRFGSWRADGPACGRHLIGTQARAERGKGAARVPSRERAVVRARQGAPELADPGPAEIWQFFVLRSRTSGIFGSRPRLTSKG